MMDAQFTERSTCQASVIINPRFFAVQQSDRVNKTPSGVRAVSDPSSRTPRSVERSAGEDSVPATTA
jgi:hypothetical protein